LGKQTVIWTPIGGSARTSVLRECRATFNEKAQMLLGFAAIAVRLQRCNYSFQLGNLTHEGISLFPNRSVGYSLIIPGFHAPDPFVQLAPPGTVLISQDAETPSFLKFESTFSFSSSFHHFSPSTMFSFPFSIHSPASRSTTTFQFFV
jgi:hypothetical protein